MGFSQVKWVLHDLFLSDKVGFFSEKLTLSGQIMGFSQIRYVSLKKPTLSADNVFFFSKRNPVYLRETHIIFIFW